MSSHGQGTHEHTTEHAATYLLTTGLEHKMRQLRQNGIQVPDSGFFEDMRLGLIDQLQACLPNVQLRCIDMQELAASILAKALEISEVRNGLIVSTCPEISEPRHGLAIDINRLVDTDGNIIGIGPRPGQQPIGSQIDVIAASSSNRPIILVEDGTFTGSTLLYIINELRKRRLSVHTIVTGFVFPAASAELAKAFSGEVHAVLDIGQPIDWVPDHDFYPFVPNSGRVIGVKMYDRIEPFYTAGDVSYSLPYIMPYGLTEWASLSDGSGRRISYYCLQQMHALYTEIERLNKNKKVRISDLMGIIPRISVPVSVGALGLPLTSLRVIDAIDEALISLS